MELLIIILPRKYKITFLVNSTVAWTLLGNWMGKWIKLSYLRIIHVCRFILSYYLILYLLAGIWLGYSVGWDKMLLESWPQPSWRLLTSYPSVKEAHLLWLLCWTMTTCQWQVALRKILLLCKLAPGLGSATT